MESGYLDGLSVYELGRLHGISRKTASAILHRRGVPMRRTGLQAAQVVEAIHLYERGASMLAIGLRFGVDDKTVGRALQRAGVQRRLRQGSASSAR